MSKVNYDFLCTPKQIKIINDLKDVDEILFGGQAGGGKSELLLMFSLLRRLTCQGSIGIIFRRTFKDLDKSLIRKSKMDLYAVVHKVSCKNCNKNIILNTDKLIIAEKSECQCGKTEFDKDKAIKERILIRPSWARYGAKWNEEKKAWFFPNGSIQDFGYIDGPDDLMNYMSGEWDDMCFDELCHFDFDWYHTMKGRSRARGDWKFLIRSATNPGNIGHTAVREYFVDPAYETIHKVFDPELQDYISRFFMPASLNDNDIYKTYFPVQFRYYQAWLSQLPETDKQHQKFGNWNYVPGAAFEELNKDIHGCDDISVPGWVPIFCSYDFGFGKPFSIGWWWSDYDGRLYRFKEWYGWNGKANQGLRMAASDVARGILKREQQMGLDGRSITRTANPDIFSKRPNIRGGGQGPSIAEIMSEHGVYWTPADPDRLLGKQQFHERLKIGEDGRPMVYFCKSCTHFWRTVPTLQLDENNIEDVDTKLEDHCLHGNTIVMTDKGNLKIANMVGTTGKVRTVEGKWTNFYDCRKIKSNVPVVKVSFSNGRFIICTPDHQFLTKRGWVEAKDLLNEKCYDIISHLINGGGICQKLFHQLNKNFKGSFITNAVFIIKKKVSDCIEKFGNPLMEKFRKIVTSIIKTETEIITRLKTLNLYLYPNINLSMQNNQTMQIGNNLCVKEQKNGMEVKKVNYGIKNNTKKIAEEKSSKELPSFVLIAGKNLRDSLEKKGQNSVHLNAEINTIEKLGKGLDLKKEYVSYAVTNLQYQNIQNKKLVAESAERFFLSNEGVKVVEVADAGYHDVYCLVADKYHAFAVEGGIIVHNCYDECKSFFMSRPLIPRQQKPEEGYFQKLCADMRKIKDTGDILDEIYDY